MAIIVARFELTARCHSATIAAWLGASTNGKARRKQVTKFLRFSHHSRYAIDMTSIASYCLFDDTLRRRYVLKVCWCHWEQSKYYWRFFWYLVKHCFVPSFFYLRDLSFGNTNHASSIEVHVLQLYLGATVRPWLSVLKFCLERDYLALNS